MVQSAFNRPTITTKRPRLLTGSSVKLSKVTVSIFLAAILAVARLSAEQAFRSTVKGTWITI